MFDIVLKIFWFTKSYLLNPKLLSRHLPGCCLLPTHTSAHHHCSSLTPFGHQNECNCGYKYCMHRQPARKRQICPQQHKTTFTISIHNLILFFSQMYSHFSLLQFSARLCKLMESTILLSIFIAEVPFCRTTKDPIIRYIIFHDTGFAII